MTLDARRIIGLHSFLKPCASSRYVLIVLNQPLDKFPISLLQELWVRSSWRICADGGANCLYDLFEKSSDNSNELSSLRDLKRRLIPNLICGDLDSLRPDVASYYHGFGVRIEKVENQDTTDFQKAICFVQDIETKEEELNDILVIGGTGGRFDQIMSNIHALYNMRGPKDRQRQLFLLDSDNAITLILPGKTRIKVLAPCEGPHCGIIPIGSAATVTTRGLQWNLDNHLISFGALISTCNLVLFSDSGQSSKLLTTSSTCNATSPSNSSESSLLEPTTIETDPDDNSYTMEQLQLSEYSSDVSVQHARTRRTSQLRSPISLNEGEMLGFVDIETDLPVIWSIEVNLNSVVT